MEQNCKHSMIAIRTSKNYILFSILQVVLSISILIYVLLQKNKRLQSILKSSIILKITFYSLRQKWVLEVEIILTLLIMIDIIIRILAEGEDFFKQKWNKIDLASFLIILLLVTIFYSLGIHANQTSTVVREFDDVVGLSLIILRYLIQIARIVIVIKQSHKVQQMRQVDDIKFEPVEKNEKNSQEKEEILEQQIEIHPQEI
ncbi:hypothetical protein pb186bvf_005491 [Paramecium bursaria]